MLKKKKEIQSRLIKRKNGWKGGGGRGKWIESILKKSKRMNLRMLKKKIWVVAYRAVSNQMHLCPGLTFEEKMSENGPTMLKRTLETDEHRALNNRKIMR